MNPLFTKAALIAAGIGGVSAVAGGIYYLNSSKDETIPKQENKQKPVEDVTIASLLNGKRLLTSTDADKWAAPWTSFKQAYNTTVPPAPWSFNQWLQKKEEPATLDSFKSQCQTLGAKKVKGISDANFIAVSTYCTTDKDPS